MQGRSEGGYRAGGVGEGRTATRRAESDLRGQKMKEWMVGWKLYSKR